MNLYATYLFSPGSQIALWVDRRQGWACEFRKLVPANILKCKLLFLLELKHTNNPDVGLEESLYNTRRHFGDLKIFNICERAKAKTS